MRTLSDTIARLTALRTPRNLDRTTGIIDRLSDFAVAGSNPGALRGRAYLPPDLPRNAALVVVLHGCTQTAAGYDTASGWSRLADRGGFALLYPEQRRENNPNLCFNWFLPGDTARDCGEALSIRQMIATLVARHDLDSARVFITGLSAGGAMASAMLAAYPQVFAGGAIIAGLPYGCASNAPEAFDRMRGHGLPTEPKLQALLRQASPHDGPWPTLSVWHGTADRTVDPANAAAIVAQWRGVHQAEATPASSVVDGNVRRAWRDPEGREVIEEYSILGMGHGAPLATLGPDGLGAPAPFMIEAGISSTRHIARFWGLAQAQLRAQSAVQRVPAAPSPALAGAQQAGAAPHGDEAPFAPPHGVAGIKKTIEDALRAAGLMR
jgi:poly(hydroxyalkanoate) depolymerase family esterase